jgi:hypothetical protein
MSDVRPVGTMDDEGFVAAAPYETRLNHDEHELNETTEK